MERPHLVRGNQGHELQPQHRPRQQSSSIRGLGLDDRRHARSGHNASDRNLDQARQRSLSEPVLRPDGLQVQLRCDNPILPGDEKLRPEDADQREGHEFRRPTLRSAGRYGEGSYRRLVHQLSFRFPQHVQHQCEQPDRAHQLRSGKPPSVGRLHPGQRPDLQRPERHSVLPALGGRGLVASRPVQRRERHQQSEGGFQLVADRGFHHPRHLGQFVPRAGVRRNLASRQRRHRRAEPRQPGAAAWDHNCEAARPVPVCRPWGQAPGRC